MQRLIEFTCPNFSRVSVSAGALPDMCNLRDSWIKWVSRERLWDMSEDKQATPPPVHEGAEITEKGAFHGSAAVTGLYASEQFISPTMNLDGPPADSGGDASATDE